LDDSAIEWFDYFLYGSVAALVFNTLFFPNFDLVVGLLLSYLSFSLTFFVRRFAGVILFHVGDCIRHKMTLVLTLYACVPQMGVPLSMLLATLAIFCDRSSIHGNHAWFANRCDVSWRHGTISCNVVAQAIRRELDACCDLRRAWCSALLRFDSPRHQGRSNAKRPFFRAITILIFKVLPA
jgi:hypothetical protein